MMMRNLLSCRHTLLSLAIQSLPLRGRIDGGLFPAFDLRDLAFCDDISKFRG